MDTKTQFPSDGDELQDRRAGIAMRAALAMLVPLARWLIRNGVYYASFAPALKAVFVEAAHIELARTGARVTDSSLSVLSGVHRRDIRWMSRSARAGGSAEPKTPSVASQVFTRWVSDPAYRGKHNQVAELAKLGPAPSFDTLARAVSSDVHPRTVLAEMERLGLAAVQGERVRLCTEAFLPQQGFDEGVQMFCANVSDHMAAAAHNLGAADAPFLEQSVYGNGLSATSVAHLGDTARRAWRQAFDTVVREATHRHQIDCARPDAQMRMRFGVYYYAEPDTEIAAQPGREADGR